MRRLAALCVALTALFASACYDTPRPDCAFLCGPDQACPEGYSCEEGWCKKDTAPDALECGDPLVDAALEDEVDAGVPDADPE